MVPNTASTYKTQVWAIALKWLRGGSACFLSWLLAAGDLGRFSTSLGAI